MSISRMSCTASILEVLERAKLPLSVEENFTVRKFILFPYSNLKERVLVTPTLRRLVYFCLQTSLYFCKLIKMKLYVHNSDPASFGV